MVSVGGTWHRCCHDSHNRVLIAVSVATGKALGIEILGHFNEGNISFLNMLQRIGVVPGFFTTLLCKKQDSLRIMKSSHRGTTNSKQKRKTLRAIKKGFGDKKEQHEELSCGREGF